ncbi:HYC_CC_PP family protein [Tenacibaculum geojense]|uniref:Transmembrane protein n=1 Tax=Tenacibaculum geojense TaxID=915352 RepID=A0ABW3JSC6_9FLAO
MKQYITKIASITIAFLVFLSTFSLTIEKHFCGDFLVDVSYFGKTKGCNPALDVDDCDSPEIIKQKGCCKDEVQKIKIQDELQLQKNKKFELEQQQFILAFNLSYANLFVDLSQQIIPHKYYSSPPIITDIQLLHEVFII